MDDPTAWLGDPVTTIRVGHETLGISVPPASRDRVVVWLKDAPSMLNPGTTVEDAFIQLGPPQAQALVEALNAAIAQLEERAEGDREGSSPSSGAGG